VARTRRKHADYNGTLAADCAAGGDAAWRALVDEFGPGLVQLARHALFTEPGAAAVAEELVQDVWTDLFEHRAALLGHGRHQYGSLRSFLAHRVLWRVADHHRKEHRRLEGMRGLGVARPEAGGTADVEVAAMLDEIADRSGPRLAAVLHELHGALEARGSWADLPAPAVRQIWHRIGVEVEAYLRAPEGPGQAGHAPPEKL
jgi:DNA-directed RNA polymerase specialized sigma24 family protein